MNRKKFVSSLAVISVGALAGALLDACSTDIPAPENIDFTIDITDPDFSGLSSPGGFAYNEGIIIVHTPQGNFVALSQACTHTGCTINYDSGLQRYPCPCHGSIYNSAGNVIRGPANKNLKTYQTTINGNSLRVFE